MGSFKITKIPKVIFILAVILIITNQITYASLTVGTHKTLELVFAANVSPENPFDTYLLKLEITDPNGEKFIIDGFFDGNGKGGQEGKIWKARICPYLAGVWSWKTVEGDAYDASLEGLHGKFICIESGDAGGVIADKEHFRFQDGDYTYLQGTFLDFAHGLRTTHTFMSETTSDAQREHIIERHCNFHSANKVNIYLANKGDYENQSVTPWLGNAATNDKTMMNLLRWRNYDMYFQRFKDLGILSEIWFFADDSNFGKLSQTIKNRLLRYAMARTSSFSNTLFVIALEWAEGWSESSVTTSGNFIQSHNPWRRMLSVHNVPPFRWEKIREILLTPARWKQALSRNHMQWAFSGEKWGTFIASQAGNYSDSAQVNRLATRIRSQEDIPHLSEEFGHLNSDSDTQVRAKMWANFCGGAAGGGTGSDLKAFMQFLEHSLIPFHRMHASNTLVEGGGVTRFCLTEEGHHYLTYSQSGAFNLNLSGNNLTARWFNPRDPNALPGPSFHVSPGKNLFTPPIDRTKDWVLWISDGRNLRKDTIYPGKGASFIQEFITIHNQPSNL